MAEIQGGIGEVALLPVELEAVFESGLRQQRAQPGETFPGMRAALGTETDAFQRWQEGELRGQRLAFGRGLVAQVHAAGAGIQDRPVRQGDRVITFDLRMSHGPGSDLLLIPAAAEICGCKVGQGSEQRRLPVAEGHTQLG